MPLCLNISCAPTKITKPLSRLSLLRFELLTLSNPLLLLLLRRFRLSPWLVVIPSLFTFLISRTRFPSFGLLCQKGGEHCIFGYLDMVNSSPHIFGYSFAHMFSLKAIALGCGWLFFYFFIFCGFCFLLLT